LVGEISLVYNYYLFSNAWWRLLEPEHLALDDILFCLTVVLHLYSIYKTGQIRIEEMPNRLCNKKNGYMVLHTVCVFVTNGQLKEIYMYTELGCILSCLHYKTWQGTGLFWHNGTLLQETAITTKIMYKNLPGLNLVKLGPDAVRIWI
jgi:hypothetical protein